MKKHEVKLGMFFFVVFSLFLNGVAKADVLGQKSLKCKTANGEKEMTLSDKFLSFNEDSPRYKFNSQRMISSSIQVKTKKSGKGMVQTLDFEGNKHKIIIKDLSKFSEVHDYLTITSPKGHEMTYPLNCQLVN
jgi:hypothetical protein